MNQTATLLSTITNDFYTVRFHQCVLSKRVKPTRNTRTNRKVLEILKLKQLQNGPTTRDVSFCTFSLTDVRTSLPSTEANKSHEYPERPRDGPERDCKEDTRETVENAMGEHGITLFRTLEPKHVRWNECAVTPMCSINW